MITRGKRAKKTEKNRLPIGSILFLGLFFLITVFLVFSSQRVYGRKKELTTQLQELEKQLEELEQRNEDLNASISRMDDEDYLEEGARERLSLKKPGEEVVVVLPSATNETALPDEENTGKNLWGKIREALGF